jgi:hypothetical protein
MFPDKMAEVELPVMEKPCKINNPFRFSNEKIRELNRSKNKSMQLKN